MLRCNTAIESIRYAMESIWRPHSKIITLKLYLSSIPLGYHRWQDRRVKSAMFCLLYLNRWITVVLWHTTQCSATLLFFLLPDQYNPNPDIHPDLTQHSNCSANSHKLSVHCAVCAFRLDFVRINITIEHLRQFFPALRIPMLKRRRFHSLRSDF